MTRKKTKTSNTPPHTVSSKKHSVDLPLKQLLSSNARYADLINVIAFDGNFTISEKDVCECDSNLSSYFPSSSVEYLNKSRDIVRKIILGIHCAIIGIENQHYIDNSMVIRSLCYDALEYDKQLQQHKRQHRKLKDLSSKEYLSGVSPSDSYAPVITFVLKTFEDNIPTDLHSLINFNRFDKNTATLLKKYTNNYIINIIDIRAIDYNKCTTDLKQVLGFLANDKNIDSLKDFIRNNKDAFQSLPEDAYEAISALSGESALLDIKNHSERKGGSVNMCKALDDMRNIARQEGREEGIRALILDNIEEHISRERTITKLEKRFSLDRQSALSFYDKYAPKTAYLS